MAKKVGVLVAGDDSRPDESTIGGSLWVEWYGFLDFQCDLVDSLDGGGSGGGGDPLRDHWYLHEPGYSEVWFGV